MSEVKLNIYQKLAKIRKPVEVLQKNKSGYNYKYVTEDLILSKISGLMEKYGVSLIPAIMPGTTHVEPYPYVKTKSTRDGKVYDEHVNDILVHGDMEWYWVNNDDPSDRIVVPWSFVGQQSEASQALGSGLSYASRYFLLKYFNVATSENDPDAWLKIKKEAEEAENKEVAKSIADQILQLITSHLENNADDRDALKELVRKYTKKSANPHDITDPLAASSLMEEVKTFIEAKEKK